MPTSLDEQTATQADENFLDVNILKEIGRKGLVDALNSVSGAKTLVLDPLLAGPVSLVTEVSLLKVVLQHGVEKMFWLETGPLQPSTQNVVYLCRPLIKYAKIIAEHIKKHTQESSKFSYTILLVPRKSTLVSRILEEEGVLGDVNISSYDLQFIPLAEDVISLENETAFKELWVDGDETVVYDSAQALLTIQKLYGLFPKIIGKGDYAARLASLLTRSRRNTDGNLPETLLAASDRIDCLIILDRRVDIITPLLTQLTYEGLIDEMIGIKNSHVEIPAALLNPPSGPSQSNSNAVPTAPTSPTVPTRPSLRKEAKKKHYLSATLDPLFGEIRDLNFSSVGKKLNKVAHRLDEDYKTRLQAKTVAQLRDFVGKLGGLQTDHQSLRLHTGLSEILLTMTRAENFNKSLEIQQNLLASYDVNAQIAAIEDLIAREADIETVIRLLCLASITAGGIKTKTLEGIKREILQVYGYNYLPLVLALTSAPLSILLPNPLPSGVTPTPLLKYPFVSLRKSLRLLIDDDPDSLDEVENDISFTYSGYAPISIRLVQCVAQKGGVLSNPAERIRGANNTDPERSSLTSASGKVQAHPIVGWKGFEDVLGSLPGETFDITQRGKIGAEASLGTLLLPSEHTTTTIVFFLGGCTYTEIAALRWVGRQNRGRKFLIATTGMLSGSSLINGISGLRKPDREREAGI